MLKWFSVSHLGVKKYWRKSNVSSMLWREIEGVKCSQEVPHHVSEFLLFHETTHIYSQSTDQISQLYMIYGFSP
jgi:hypothetical protein